MRTLLREIRENERQAVEMSRKEVEKATPNTQKMPQQDEGENGERPGHREGAIPMRDPISTWSL